jgi:hypothetical protein
MSHVLNVLQVLFEDEAESSGIDSFAKALSKKIAKPMGLPKPPPSPRPPPTYHPIGYLDKNQKFRFRRTNGTMRDFGPDKGP